LVVEFWSEITQDKDDQDEECFYVQEGKDVNLNKNSFGCSLGMELSFYQRLN
jgi:hypothetical protein